ncbi:hypothetical protein SH601_16350 [Gracilibacillus sp. S3-1-1]|uniref:Uncharacterized protein n=1 Tax=Gracilibacillus pellucidus TaxID=3095368 RepID=A0ACC6M980_9BACI|nr:hypothetical protein [Gracilibacillus sp. S3-1-1]MDX8047539.1 hypothetical protein [Gracilibacillus sp. S3-1-1]
MNFSKYIKEFQPLINIIVLIAATYIIVYGMTLSIDLLAQLAESMYAVGHQLGVFLKDIFN